MKLLRVIASEVGRGLIAGFRGRGRDDDLEHDRDEAAAPAAQLARPPTPPARCWASSRATRRASSASRPSFTTRTAARGGWRARRLHAAFGAAGGARSIAAPIAFFALVWGASLAMLPALGIAKPFWRWGAKEVAIDAFHHTVYAAATDGAYRLLGRA